MDALAYFSHRLAFETDVADVAAALEAGGDPGFVLLDARSPRTYEAGHLPGARLLPRPFAAEDVAALGDALLVVYCWGPACNGATKAARELAALGRPVKEMIGGFEYWERDGHPVERGVPRARGASARGGGGGRRGPCRARSASG